MHVNDMYLKVLKSSGIHNFSTASSTRPRYIQNVLYHFSSKGHSVLSHWGGKGHNVLSHYSSNVHNVLSHCSSNDHNLLSHYSNNGHIVLSHCNIKGHNVLFTVAVRAIRCCGGLIIFYKLVYIVKIWIS